MKNTLLIAITALSLSACNGSNVTGELLDPTRVYEVDAWGTNPDIYEFTPKGHKNMTCLIVVSGRDVTGGITCFKKDGS